MDPIKILQIQVEVLKQEIELLKAANTIPYDVEAAFRTRLRLDLFTVGGIISSGKVASSENQIVNEGGASVYNVLKPPDAFVQTVIGATTYYIPVYT